VIPFSMSRPNLTGGTTRMPERFSKILKVLNKYRLDGLLLNSEPNVSYAAAFHAPDSYVVATRKGLTLITDFRYMADFQKKAGPPLKVLEYKRTLFKTLARQLKKERVRDTGFESRHLSFAECEKLHELLGKGSRFIPLKETLEPSREVKEESELANIKKAIEITRDAYAFIDKTLKPGISELRVSAEIERFIRLKGAQGPAFKIIVASGPNSSYPHAEITDRILKNGDPVIIDMGVEYNGYKCDLTRTFFLGKINPVVRKVRAIVLEAQRRAIKAIRPGIRIKDVDAVARNYIAQKGFAKFFGHALGHGVGLEVHEAPSINRKNDHRIKAGSVFTVEPGIYLAGEFGVRIEDIVLVTQDRAEVLSGDCRDQPA